MSITHQDINLIDYFNKLSYSIVWVHDLPVWSKRVNANAPSGKVAGSIENTGYRSISVHVEGNRKRILAHRLRWFMHYGYIPSMIDHINRNRLDNRIENLREVYFWQNQRNITKIRNASSKYKGVSRTGEGRKKGWQAGIQKNGRWVSLGRFYTEEEAAIRYDQECIKMGIAEYCTLNFGGIL